MFWNYLCAPFTNHTDAFFPLNVIPSWEQGKVAHIYYPVEGKAILRLSYSLDKNRTNVKSWGIMGADKFYLEGQGVSVHPKVSNQVFIA